MTKKEVLAKAERIRAETEGLTLAKAASGALIKWHAIKRGTRTVKSGLEKCDLCTLFWPTTDCKGCPLQEAGYGCLTDDSVWLRLEEVILQDLPAYFFVEHLVACMYDQVYQACAPIILETAGQDV